MMGIFIWGNLWQLFEPLVVEEATTSLAGRQEIWLRATYALRDFAFTGIGIGTFDLVIPGLYPYIGFDANANIPHAHSLFLQVGVDLGVPGLVAYVGLLVNACLMLVRVLRGADALSRTLAAGTLGALTAMIVHGLFDAVTWGTKLSFMPWLLFALATLLYLPSMPQVLIGGLAQSRKRVRMH